MITTTSFFTGLSRGRQCSHTRPHLISANHGWVAFTGQPRNGWKKKHRAARHYHANWLLSLLIAEAWRMHSEPKRLSNLLSVSFECPVWWRSSMRDSASVGAWRGLLPVCYLLLGLALWVSVKSGGLLGPQRLSITAIRLKLVIRLIKMCEMAGDHAHISNQIIL